jgi:hypothetical protein
LLIGRWLHAPAGQSRGCSDAAVGSVDSVLSVAVIRYGSGRTLADTSLAVASGPRGQGLGDRESSQVHRRRRVRPSPRQAAVSHRVLDVTSTSFRLPSSRPVASALHRTPRDAQPSHCAGANEGGYLKNARSNASTLIRNLRSCSPERGANIAPVNVGSPTLRTHQVVARVGCRCGVHGRHRNAGDAASGVNHRIRPMPSLGPSAGRLPAP